MSRGAWVAASIFVVALLTLTWVAYQFGVFASSGALDRDAEALDGGVLDEWPFEDTDLDASVPDDAGPDAGARPSAGHFDGKAGVGLKNFSMKDHQGREVLRIQRLRGFVDLSALRKGTYRVYDASARGIHLTLYRTKSGKISIADALREPPASAKAELEVPSTPVDGNGRWLVEIGPVQVQDATLTLGFTKKPVTFRVDSAVVTVRRRPQDESPMIYLQDVVGVMLEPKPLPKPVRIAYAKGVVRLAGAPMGEISARTCLAQDELRVHAVVPARKKPVTLTVDSSGLAGALGRMGVKIASRRNPDKLHFLQGPVKLDEGARCK